ncbi:MAG: ribosome silencing factor [Cyanobacteria bacterium P01_A01_bin.135]
MANRPNADRTFETFRSDDTPVKAVIGQPDVDQSNISQSDKNSGGNESLALALSIVEAADDRKAADIAVLDVADVSYLADYFVVMTGYSNVQVRAIARAIDQSVEDRWGRTPQRVEGITDGNWILLDYGDIIVHIFMPREREYYGLEAFWGHARRVDLAQAS